MMFGREWFSGGSCLMGGGLWGGLIMLGLFLIVLALVFLIVRGTRRFGPGPKDDRLLEDLKRRYADGQLSEEEYLRKKEVLKRS